MGWTTCVTGTLWVTCLALFFQAVGFAIPFWVSFVIQGSGDTEFGVFLGVWYSMACVKGESDSCKSHAIEPRFDDEGLFDDVTIQGNSQEILVEQIDLLFGHNEYWMAIQISTTVGLFLTLLATLILICCRCAGIHSRCSFVSAAVCLLFGGLISLGITITAVVWLAEEFTFADLDITGETFPWSMLLFGIGACLALIAAMMVAVICCKWRRYGAYGHEDKDSLDDVPMSNVNEAYGRDPYEAARKEYNHYDRTRYGYDREGSRGSRKYEYRDTRDYRSSGDSYRDGGYRDSYRDSYRDGYTRDRGDNYDYDRSLTRHGQDYMYRPYHRY